MKSEFFVDFGIPLADCEIVSGRDDHGTLRLWFKSRDNPRCGLDLADSHRLSLLLAYAGETAHADEIFRHIKQAVELWPEPAFNEKADREQGTRPRYTQWGSARRKVAGRLLLAAIAIALWAPGAGARELAYATTAAPESEAAVETHGGTRRQILERAFAGSGVTLEWFDKKFADEAIEGGGDVTVETAATRLLARTNYIIVYDTSRDEPRMTRLLVLGRGLPSAKAAELQGKLAALRPRRRIPAASSADAAGTHERMQQVRAKALERMQASAEAVRERARELGSSAQPLRTQAVSRVPLAAFAQRGTIPVVPDPRRGR